MISEEVGLKLQGFQFLEFGAQLWSMDLQMKLVRMFVKKWKFVWIQERLIPKPKKPLIIYLL